MTAAEVRAIVAREISEYVYDPPPPGSTAGVAWSADRMYAGRDQLCLHLIEPQLFRFWLRDTYAQVFATEPIFAELWAVAKLETYVLFFDPDANEFGLAQAHGDEPVLLTNGVRGDLVGVYLSA